MPKRALLYLFLALSGCAPGASQPRSVTPARVETRAPEGRAEREATRALRERVRELEAAVALAQSEARELREGGTVERARVTRIGARPVEEDASMADVVSPIPTEGPRPMLRLYGSAPVAAVSPMQGPSAPAVVAAPPPPSLRLPVTPSHGGVPVIPVSPVVVVASEPVAPARPSPLAPAVPAAPAPRPAVPDPAGAAYRTALGHLAARRLEPALAGLDAFLRDHPRHPYAENAQYWRAEIHYARRDYRRALAELTALIERSPAGAKVPEALLRMGQCHQRMGERERARQVFDRLRAQFPDSVAARTAPREDV